MTSSEQAKPKKPLLSEDWIATLIGLAIVFIIGAGLFGPGPQTVTLKVEAGATLDAEALARDGWTVTATLGDEKLTLAAPYDDLNEGLAYTYRCQEGQLVAVNAEANADIKDNKALLILDNQCSAKVTLTYKTSSAIPWPLIK